MPMFDQRIGEINKLMKEVSGPLIKLSALLEREDISYEMIRGDLDREYQRRDKLIQENNQIKEQIAKMKEMADGMFEVAKEEAQKIIDSAIAKNVQAIAVLEEVKEYGKSVQKKDLVKHMDKVLEQKELLKV